MQRIFYTVLAILLLYVQSAAAAIPELVLKKTADTSQMAQARVIKKSEFKYVPNPQKWEYVFTDGQGRDYWLDKSSIEASPEDMVIRFSFFNSYVAENTNMTVYSLARSNARYRLGFAVVNYDENTFTVKRQTNYHSDAATKMGITDLRGYFKDYTLKELGSEKPIVEKGMTHKFAELLRPYLTSPAPSNEPVHTKPAPKQGNTSIKFI